MANKILKLAALAGLGYAGFNALSSSDKQATTKALGFTSVPQNENDFVELIKTTIKSDKDLQRLLKGNDGISVIGPQGPQGAVGPAGDTLTYLRSSIIGNSAAYNDSLTDFTGDATIGADYEGLATINLAQSKFLYSKLFPIDIRKIYAVEFTGKTTGSAMFLLKRYSKTKQMILNSGDSLLYVANNTITNTAFAAKKILFSATVGEGVTQHNINTAYAQLVVYSTTGVCDLSRLVLREVRPGECVPHNLAYLPEGQLVVNNTTGAVGRYNGSNVDWFM